MENKYKEGEVVYALIDPSVKLMVRRYLKRIYYCTVQSDSTLPERVYFERELTNDVPIEYQHQKAR